MQAEQLMAPEPVAQLLGSWRVGIGLRRSETLVNGQPVLGTDRDGPLQGMPAASF